MKRRAIILLESARRDLRDLTQWLNENASKAIARRYVSSVQKRISQLHYAGERGTIRDARSGMRIIGILPNTSLAFTVDENAVYIVRVLHGGQSFDEVPNNDPDDD